MPLRPSYQMIGVDGVHIQLDPSLGIYTGRTYSIAVITGTTNRITLLTGAFLDGSTSKSFAGPAATMTFIVLNGSQVAILTSTGAV